jgi:Xaa-Pro dipeptidase
VDPFAVNEAACRGRQRRLLVEMQALGVGLTVLSSREGVQWLTGAHVRPPFEPVAVLRNDGRVLLVVPERQLDVTAAVDERIGYAAQLTSTLVDDQRAASAAVLKSAIGKIPRRVGAELAACSAHLWFLAANGAEFVDAGQVLFRLRRRKDPDELTMLRRANEANEAMYARAREIIRPGLNELDLYSELHTVAVRTLGEPLTYFGQDFRCGARGGPPRDRAAGAGELWILDLGVGFRGYFSDNARTIAVGGSPSKEQLKAYDALAQVFPFIEQNVQPGVSCKMLYDTVMRDLAAHKPWICNHHLGHGVGLAAHEGPHLNPNWDDHFAEGDYFTVEPGLYHEELRHGIRLEQNYVVTVKGVELLTPWPLELV